MRRLLAILLIAAVFAAAIAIAIPAASAEDHGGTQNVSTNNTSIISSTYAKLENWYDVTYGSLVTAAILIVLFL